MSTLEVLTRNGCPGSTVKEQARELLSEFGSLSALTDADPAVATLKRGPGSPHGKAS